MEHIVAENSDKEDSYENKVKVFRKMFHYHTKGWSLCEDHRALNHFFGNVKLIKSSYQIKGKLKLNGLHRDSTRQRDS